MTIIEQPTNKGLAKSLIEGATDVINKHAKVIVLEDDLIVSQYFSYNMNDSLNRYEHNDKVGQSAPLIISLVEQTFLKHFLFLIRIAWVG